MFRNFTEKFYFWRFCILLCIISSLGISQGFDVQNVKSVGTEAGTESIREDVIWEYLLDKYSSSRSSLSASDLARMVDSLGKCPSSQNEVKAESDQKHPSCQGVTLKLNETYDKSSSLNHVCHKLLFFLDNPNCCNSSLNPAEKGYQSSGLTRDESSQINTSEKPSTGEVWGYGILCVTLISMCSLVGVSVMPFMKKNFYKNLLTSLIGLAVGSLTGSAVFHLLPQALELQVKDTTHEYLNISLVLCGGVWLFFMVERILKFISDYKDRKDRHWNREKISSVVSSTPDNSTISMLVDNGNGSKRDSGNIRSISMLCAASEPGVVYECQEQAIKASFGHQDVSDLSQQVQSRDGVISPRFEPPGSLTMEIYRRPRLTSTHEHTVKFEQGKDSVIATVAWMIIFGDGLHNFIDGLSIGAAFNKSILTGVSVSMAVLCEELPHELGDFAVLLNAGMSIKQALTYNFLSACTCYLGMAVGIYLGEDASTYIFALASGMFLYIALVDMVPEMNEIAEETSKISLKKGFAVLFLQNVGLFIGVTTLFLLAKYQNNFNLS